MFEVTKNKEVKNSKPRTIYSQKNKIPKEYQPFILAVVYALLITFTSLIFNSILEVVFNESILFKTPFYITVFFIVTMSLLLPIKKGDDLSDEQFQTEEIKGFSVEIKKVSNRKKWTSKEVITNLLARSLTIFISFTVFLYFYIGGQQVDKYERLTFHNVHIKGVDSVQVAIRLSRNTRDSATPGRFKVFKDPSVSEKGTYIYEEYTYGFPYEMIAPDKNKDAQNGKKYLKAKRAKIFVKWYGEELSPEQVKGALKEVLHKEDMNNLLLENFGEVVKIEHKTI
ncbi:hypothetical protein [Flammeovirga agarivorans]|uniref:Uncharacterized protein n=1 Tax=Flammeovirga agarivorans TaxID=2726742 RepID=A0A7X8SJJ1_9BACT|nr:hypothetical protein [Flammeovirga agarivorans]NLR91282.1 hypothetical protein [Flammeovirga agarivorans]